MIKPNQETVISIEGVSKKYYLTGPQSQQRIAAPEPNFFWALKNITLNLNKGDTLGIIGANGSGKTTLLKILSQVTPPTSGKIIQYGKLIPIIDIGSGFHPDLTGRENIFLYGTIMLGMTKSEIEKNIPDIIEFSELGHFINEPIKNYSNGMYLRLALSVALFCKLDVLLLDEVFSVGDNAFMQKSYEKINQIIKQAATVVLASHNLDDIMRICNKCMWLDKGEIKMIGNTNEIISAYVISNGQQLEDRLLTDQFHTQNHAEWTLEEAPQTEHFLLNSVSIYNNTSPEDTLEFDYNLPMQVEIVYTKKQNDCEIGFSIMITDHYNTPLLLSSHNFDSQNNFSEFGQLGTFKYSCIIAAKFLNLGIYKINLSAFINNQSPLLYVKDVLTFRVTSNITSQSTILRGNPTKLAPSFIWELCKL
ncbi:MAG: polysaccharide ABC transporter ATP-binding protein [Chitinophagales bacterium]